MEADDRAFVLCLTTLRWVGLSCTRITRSATGEFIATDSALSLLANVALIGFFLFLFFETNLYEYSHTAEIYKTSPIVYPLYTKIIIASVVAFLLCGNVYNRKFVGILNRVRQVTKRLEQDFGVKSRPRGRNGCRILTQVLLYAGMVNALKITAELHLVIHYEKKFRIVHHICAYYATLFTAHFLVTMNHMREAFSYMNLVFKRMVRRVSTVSEGSRNRRGFALWAEALAELREVEGLINEVFGKQIFLTQSLAFASLIINCYYFITLNLYGTSHLWLNFTIFFGTSEAVAIALMNSRAADLAAREANRVKEIIFSLRFHLEDLRTFNQVKHLAIFIHYYPVEFRAWVFYTVNYEALFKVLLTSCAITLVLLQCDFLTVRLLVSNQMREQPIFPTNSSDQWTRDPSQE